MSNEEALTKLKDAERAVDELERNGQVQDAENLREKIQPIRDSYESFVAEQTSKKQVVLDYDFLNPTPKMIKEAADVGVDLCDSRVQRIMHQVIQERKATSGDSDEADRPEAIIENVMEKVREEKVTG